MTQLRDRVLRALTEEQAPGHDTDVIAAGMVRALSETDGEVSFVLEAPGAPADLRARIEARIAAVEGVRAVRSYLAEIHDEAAPQLADGPRAITGVKHVLLVGSGKGGVGKSTVSTNLALGLADLGLKVGLLDADIYGPSLPRMMGTDGRPVSYDGTLIPVAAHGIKLLSLGMMMAQDQALVWRGPILASTLAQLVHEVRWAPLDVLVIDLPPGTGDVQITLAQEAKLSGAVIVSTPQGVAINDARRAIDLFQRTDTPILGLIENMSTHLCSGCGKEEPIFGKGGTEAEAERLGLPLLGALPLEAQVCQAAEDGMPVLRAAPDSLSAQRFGEIAQRVWDALETAAVDA